MPNADLVWLDPGETTGVAILSVQLRWLEGYGDADWLGLRKAIKHSYFAQVGFDAREWDGERARPMESKDRPAAFTNRVSGPKVEAGLANELEQTDALRDLLELWPKAAWGYEDYVPESMAAAQKLALVPMRLFAALTYTSVLDQPRGYARTPFVQSRTFKSTATDDRMKEAGLYLPGMGHATDAARHAAVFLRRARQKRELRVQAWPRLFGAGEKDD